MQARGLWACQRNLADFRVAYEELSGSYSHLDSYCMSQIISVISLICLADCHEIHSRFLFWMDFVQEVLVLGMASVCSTWGLVQQEVCGSLIPMFLLGHSNSPFVLRQLWDINSKEVIKAMVGLFEMDSAHIPRILDVCQVLFYVQTSLRLGSWGQLAVHLLFSERLYGIVLFAFPWK